MRYRNTLRGVVGFCLCALVAGCTTTRASFEATGAQIVSPYGLINFGWIKYNREAEPKEHNGKQD